MSDVRSHKGLKRHDSNYVEVTTDSSPRLAGPAGLSTGSRSNLVHVAEIHDSKSKLIGSSGEENWAQQRTTTSKIPRKQPVQLRKRFRQPRKGSETDTLSEVDSGEASGDAGANEPSKSFRLDTTEKTLEKSSHSKTLVVPSARRVKRTLPADTSTSVEMSSAKDSQGSVASRKSRHRQPRRGSLTDTLSEATDSESTVACRPVAPPRPSLESTALDSQDALSRQESIDQPQPLVRVKKSKRKKITVEEVRAASEMTDCDSKSELDAKENAGQNVAALEDADDMVVVRVQCSDPLRFLDFCRCPTLRLHVVDPATGEYKQSSTEPQSTVQPLETQPFNMKIHRSVKPVWEEDLVIKEPSSVIISKKSILLFEIFDYVKRNTIAWAFLKLVASNGASNVGKPLRLQMFKPTRNAKHQQQPATIPQCYSWWSRGKYCQYKSTLYLSVKSISSTAVGSAVSSSSAGQNAQSSQLHDTTAEDLSVEEDVTWSRYPGQSCKLPNTLLRERENGKDGSLCLAFSHNGKLLAVPTSAGIQLYSVPTVKLYLALHKQQGLIYDVSWSENDEYLVSVSADSTACLWHVKNKITSPIKILAHPSYVYCCAWIGPDLFATGCNDGIVRIWPVNNSGNTRLDSTSVEFLSKHSSRVNSVASAERWRSTHRTESTDTDTRSTDYILVSGDSSGVIIVWKFHSHTRTFVLEQELKLKELRGHIINKILIAGKKGEASRILVQTRDSLIRLLDLNSGSTLQMYEGGYVVKSKAGGCALCGCGRRVWSPSEDASLVAWDYATGERVASYSVARVSPHATLSLAMHPLDHIVAFTSHSPSDYPALTVLQFTRDGDGSTVGQIMLERGRRGQVRWSALESPLYPVPQVRVQPPPGLRKPVTPVSTSRPSPVPTPIPRTTRRFSGEVARTGADPNAASNRAAKQNKKCLESCGMSAALHSTSSNQEKEISISKDQNPLSRDSRLSDIIGKMDLILIQASPKQTASVK